MVFRTEASGKPGLLVEEPEALFFFSLSQLPAGGQTLGTLAPKPGE